MAISNLDDFIGIFNIGQKSSVAVQEKVEYFINLYEPEYLIKCMGKDLYDDFINNPIDVKYIDIMDVLNSLESPLIAYIHFHYVRGGNDFNSGTGIKRPNASNSSDTPSSYTAVRSWDWVIKGTREIRTLIYNDSDLRNIANPKQMSLDLIKKINNFDL